MFSWLKKHFIPHQDNNHRPHFLHAGNVRQIIGVVLLFELILFILPTLNFVDLVKNSNLSAVLPAVLAAGTNRERQANNLSELATNDLLSQAAQQKAEDMAEKGYFAHTSPEGRDPWYWLDLVGYSYEYAGENLAVNFSDSTDVTEAWMNSPTHRSNIVKNAYTEMGTGVAIGMYKGRESIFVVQFYANPKPAVQKTSKHIAVEEILDSEIAVAATEEKEQIIAQAETENKNVLGQETSVPAVQKISDPQREPSWLESTLASPRQTTSTVFYIVIGIVVLALFLNLMIKFEHQHPDLVTNGLFAIVFIVGIFLVNSYVAKAHEPLISYTDTNQHEVK